MNRRLFSSVTILLFLVLTATAAIAQDDPSTPGDEANAASEKSSEPLKIGSPAPALDIEYWISDAGGKFKPVTDLEEGKVYVVEFWATWCGPCIHSMPHLAEIQTQYSDQEVQVISLSDESLEKVEKFLERDYKPRTDKAASEEDSESTPKTYAELTSVYCLTTDPDKSVFNDYFRASGRRGIPAAYIVGKTGLIEWMGHPNGMDNALKSVVNESWDRVAFAKEYATEQKRDLMLTRISGILKTSPPEEALKAIKQARKEFVDDATATTTLGSMEDYIVMAPLYKSVDAGENVKALELINELYPTVSEKVKRQFLRLQVQLQLKESQFDEAAKTLALIGSEKSFSAVELTRIAGGIYKQSKGSEEFPQALFVHGIALSQRAVDADGNNPYYLSTLARMQQGSGDLDAAIETQIKAVAQSSGANKGYQVILDQLKAEKDSNDEPESKSAVTVQ